MPRCCGRPLYAWGMLDLGKKLLTQVLKTMGAEIDAGVPVVGLEPACIATFRDELPNLFPDNERAQRLSKQSFMLGEFLARNGHEPPRLAGRALVQAHCHQHAVIGLDGQRKLLDKLGLDYEVLNAGCCGMAGSFGFEASHYDVSMKAAERMLLPAVRQADPDVLIIANGFSCREQIAQGTNRRSLHLAEVLRQAHDRQRAHIQGGQ